MGLIDRERQYVVANGIHADAEFLGKAWRGFFTSCDENTHDLSPALNDAPHGRFTSFPLALAVCQHSNYQPNWWFEKFRWRNFPAGIDKKADTSNHSPISK